MFWKNGERTETSVRVTSRLQMYWLAVDESYTAEQIRDSNFQDAHPWSSAFISWVMKRAGAKDDFHYSAAHRVYVSAAKANQLNNLVNPFKAYPVREQAVSLGDIVVKRRGSTHSLLEKFG